MNQHLKRIRLSLCLIAVVVSVSHGQYISTQPTNPYTSPVDFEFRTNSALLIAKGAYTATTNSGVLTPSDMGSGTRLIWFPGLAAFRAGRVTGTQWDDSSTNGNIGIYSAALGLNTTASGSYSFSAGYGNSASATYTTAFGYGTQATKSYAVATGYSTLASGSASLSSGRSTTAQGDYSSSFGNSTTAFAYGSMVIGRFNSGSAICTVTNLTISTNSVNSWISADPVFEVGNGSASVPSDAFVVYKNGQASVQGALTAKGGVVTSPSTMTSYDIPMLGH